MGGKYMATSVMCRSWVIMDEQWWVAGSLGEGPHGNICGALCYNRNLASKCGSMVWKTVWWKCEWSLFWATQCGTCTYLDFEPGDGRVSLWWGMGRGLTSVWVLARQEYLHSLSHFVLWSKFWQDGKTALSLAKTDAIRTILKGKGAT